ncbi:MAG: carbonic anhydrase family protein [Rhodocyclaceae bacterium]|nr:carbonic anhydrase family protein [Rhodocyclaceae bacterium]
MSAAATFAHAADWQKIAVGRGEKMEIDGARISSAQDGRMLAWSRLLLKQEATDAESGARYTAVEALNSYDCANARFATLKRLYMQGEKLVRVEPVLSPREMAVGQGGIDAALLSQVCASRPVQQVRRSDPAEKAAGESKFGVMHAEMVTGGTNPGTDQRNRTMSVADKAPAEKPAEAKGTEKPVDAAAKAEAPKRLLELPKIDKSQLEYPKDDPRAEAKPDSKADAKGAKGAEPPPLPVADRHSRELALATSGLRRAARKKPEFAVEPTHGELHWGYEGDGGPANWSRLDARNALCASGKRQSPIEIADSIRVDLEPIRFEYKASTFRIEDTGHTIQASLADGGSLTVMGRRYELKQLHFHRPGEEKIDGKRFDMVAHLVHRDDEGNLAVVAVQLEKGGAEHSQIQTLWNNMPLEAGMSLMPAAAIDPAKLLPEKQTYYTYMGSLTTPPCTENVLWMVLKQPVALSAEQVAIFSRLYKNNARPIQPLNGRLIKESR